MLTTITRTRELVLYGLAAVDIAFTVWREMFLDANSASESFRLMTVAGVRQRPFYPGGVDEFGLAPFPFRLGQDVQLLLA